MVNDHRHEGIVLHNLGILEHRRSDIRTAMLRYTQALELHRATHNETFILKTLRMFASAELALHWQTSGAS